MVNAALLLTVLPAVLSSVAVAAPAGSFNLPPTRQASTVGMKTKPLTGAPALQRANSLKVPSTGSASSSSGGFQMQQGRPRANAFKIVRPGSGGNGNVGGSSPLSNAAKDAAAGIPRFNSIKSSGSSGGFVMREGRPRADAIGGSSGGFVMNNGRPRANAIAGGSSSNQVINGRPAIIQGQGAGGNNVINGRPAVIQGQGAGSNSAINGRPAIIQGAGGNNAGANGGNPFQLANQAQNGRPAVIQGANNGPITNNNNVNPFPLANQVQNGRPAIIQGQGAGNNANPFPQANQANNGNPFPQANQGSNGNPFPPASN